MKSIINKKNDSSKKEWPSYFNGIKSELELLEENLSTKLIKKESLLYSLISHIFNAGGKRIRPAIGFLIAKGTGKFSEKQITLAEITELIHTASLVHDDIIDSANFRRGKETINNLWNDKISVITGDYLFAQSSIRLGILENTEIVKIYAQVLADLCEGEIDQFAKKYNTDITWDYYINKSYSKTGSLFAAVCKSAAILNNLTSEEINKANEFGKSIGIAFQIVDDILDYTSSQNDLGKDVCGDLKSGLITAPALFALENNCSDSIKLKSLIESRFSNEGDIEEAILVINKLEGIKKAKDLAIDYTEKAKSNLSIIKDINIKNDLCKISDSILDKVSI